ncbi:DNA-3-methyladenine glycosylase [Mycetocola zhujimingii]|uniref:DNA-3-methyladenine glycosylase n=1 Tax=Mycetocola zhujimingii TaxID=2079792 RepID=UPI0018E082BC|nr:DNA-3-methyladenine glycosylase [Mycetocola zhujimingii]
MFDRAFFERPSVDVAPHLLGAVLRHTTDAGTVGVRITEVEAYIGQGVDPGSHAFRGKTARNASMFGEPGHLYCYFTYGMHVCANVVCSPDGEASACLIRAGEVVEGIELARFRRTTSKSDRDLAQGPARLVVALGISLAQNGSDLFAPPFSLEPAAEPAAYETGPRTGVAGGADLPWRFWIPGESSVSPYKRHPKV